MFIFFLILRTELFVRHWMYRHLVLSITPPDRSTVLKWSLVSLHEPKGRLTTCQLFLAQRREIFILKVPGFSKTTRLCPKISEDVPNYFEVLKKMIMLHTDLQKTDFGESIVIFSFHMDFSFLALV